MNIFNSISSKTPSIYRSEEKIDEMLSSILGSLSTSISISSEQKKERQSKLKIKLGELLAALGVGSLSGEINTKVLNGTIQTSLSSLTYSNKLNILQDYLNKENRSLSFNLFEGIYAPTEEFWGKAKTDEKLESIPLNYSGQYYGQLIGRFEAVRIHPPHDEKSDYIADIMDKNNSLWEWRTVKESKFKGSFGWLPKYCSNISQATLISLAKGKVSATISVTGFISVENGNFNCDPLDFVVFI